MVQPESDLEGCAREPIHIPGAIQPHGALFVLRPSDMTVIQASANASDLLGSSLTLGKGLTDLEPAVERIRGWYESGEPALQVAIPDRGLILIAHRSNGLIIVEVEEAEEATASGIFSGLRSFIERLAAQADTPGSLNETVRFVQELTGFDRVLAYRFDDAWNGQVVAEAGNGRLPSYLDLRFPASDIPAQARALYATNRVRLIPDASYEPVPLEPALNPETNQPLDLSAAQLRSVSPVHLEYMRNMGTAASMSISIMIDGNLWGLISCHSARPHKVSSTLRDLCDFVVQSLAMRIAAQERAAEASQRVDLSQVTGRLLASMSARSDWVEGLAEARDDLLRQVGATGAAIMTDARCICLGSTPAEPQLQAIVHWLEQRGDAEEVFATASLSAQLPSATDFADTASGILAVRLSKLYPSWLIWVRPEVHRTVTWGGDPHKHVAENGRIHPRKSFEAWQEQVRLQALPWTAAEIAAARDLRAAIVGIVLRRAEELAELTSELQRSNKELEAFSYSVSHDLRAPFRHIVGFAQLLREREGELDEKSRHYLSNISESALAAGRLVDDLLNFSHLGRTAIVPKKVDINKLVSEVVKSVMLTQSERKIEWRIAPLPVAWGDSTLLRQVWYNLVDNAVKYTRDQDPAVIAIDGSADAEQVVYRISDNGVGFDMAYVGKLFGVFQRLQRAEDFEGTGIGLALARRIIERHGGSITATGEVGKGAEFVFALPTPDRKGRAIA